MYNVLLMLIVPHKSNKGVPVNRGKVDGGDFWLCLIRYALSYLQVCSTSNLNE